MNIPSFSYFSQMASPLLPPSPPPFPLPPPLNFPPQNPYQIINDLYEQIYLLRMQVHDSKRENQGLQIQVEIQQRELIQNELIQNEVRMFSSNNTQT
jgi:hypothetical protein